VDVRIPVGKTFAIVDAEDAEQVGRYAWRLARGRPIANTFKSESPDGKQHTMQMSHVVMGKPPKGMMWDHVDRDTLNNRRSNLRLATNSQNQANTGPRRGSSRYKGVSWMKSKGRWMVQFRHEGQDHFVGYFHDEHRAAVAYNQAVLKIVGEFAYQNLVPSEGGHLRNEKNSDAYA